MACDSEKHLWVWCPLVFWGSGYLRRLLGCWRSHSDSNCLLFQSEPSAFCLPPRYLNSLTGKFFSVGFEAGISLSSFLFFGRTSLWLGENRGPSVRDILRRVSLLPPLRLSQTRGFCCTAFRDTNRHTSCCCCPAVTVFQGRDERAGPEPLLPQLGASRKPGGSCWRRYPHYYSL